MPKIETDFEITKKQTTEWVDELIKYSQKIALTTGAPPGWAPPAPLLVYRPPAPQDEMLRAGYLYAAGAPPAQIKEEPKVDEQVLPPHVQEWKADTLAQPDTIVGIPATMGTMEMQVNKVPTNASIELDLSHDVDDEDIWEQ